MKYSNHKRVMVLEGSKLKKKAVLIVVVAILIVVSAAIVSHERRFIGEITGTEWNILAIAGTEYRQINGLDYTIADKGKFLGKANYYGSTVRLYSVKSDQEGKYIYAFWDWEGFFYVRKE